MYNQKKIRQLVAVLFLFLFMVVTFFLRNPFITVQAIEKNLDQLERSDRYKLIPANNNSKQEKLANLTTITTKNAQTSTSKKRKGLVVDLKEITIQGESIPVDFTKVNLSIRTGDKNFDPDDAPGHDASPTNNLVRTWDKVSYNYSFSLQSTDSQKKYTNIKYKVEAYLENARTNLNGQLRDNAYFPEGVLTGNQASLTRSSTYSTEGTIDSAGIVDSVINIQVLGATHQYELKPEIYITILEATDSESGEVVPINKKTENIATKSVYVSAKPYIKAYMGYSSNAYHLMSQLTGDSNLNAMGQAIGVKVSLVPLEDQGIKREGSLYEKLLGATYPTGEITVKVNSKATFSPDNGSGRHIIEYGVDQDAPKIVSYGLLYNNLGLIDLTKTSEFKHYNLKNILMSTVWNIPFSIDKTGNRDDSTSVFDSNQVMAKNSGGDTLSFTITNPAAIHKDSLANFIQNINESTFASVASLISIPYSYKLDKAGTLSTIFTATEVAYEENKQINDSQYTYNMGNTLPGSATAYSNFFSLTPYEYIGSGISESWSPSGDGAVYKNQQLNLEGIFGSEGIELKFTEGISVWNANTFEYDASRNLNPYIAYSQTTTGKVVQTYYGVLKNGSMYPGLDCRFTTINPKYNWYTSYAEAKKAGVISGIKSRFEKTGLGARFITKTIIPLKVKSNTYAGVDQYGNPNIAISTTMTQNEKSENKWTYPSASLSNLFTPTKYDAANKLISYQIPQKTYGETLLVVPFTARLTKATDKTSYRSDEVVRWNLTPRIGAGSDETLTFTIKDTLPKELSYITGSAKYGSNEIEPKIKENPDGTTALTWTITYHPKINPTQKLTFDSMVNGRKIVYDAMNTCNIENSAIISITNKEGATDDSAEKLRTAQASTTITKVATTSIEKTTTKSKIEVGSTDPAVKNSSQNVEVQYDLYTKNNTQTPTKDVKVLDILPISTDGRGSTFSGKFHLLKLTVSGGTNAQIYYTKQTLSKELAPNDVDITKNGWTLYNSGEISNIKAIFVHYEELATNEETTIKMNLKVENQKVNDSLVNSVKLDNYNHNPVESVHIKTSVVGRSIQGVAWYDDNVNGKKDNTEQLAANIPVKLYRTSKEETTYKNKLVTEDLRGNLLIDDQGKSLVTTNNQGIYRFTNLPEGEYVVYFDIGNQITTQKFKITRKDNELSSQMENTSKVNCDTLRTDSYLAPPLESGQFLNNEATLQNINIGLIRPSKVSLFKYAAGSAKDSNGDQKLSDAEKMTGTPLKAAKFELYLEEDGVKKKIGVASTDEKGYVEFDTLFPGKYELIETKSPEGYELVKTPIPFTIEAGNKTIELYQDDAKDTLLPFTGSSSMAQLLLLFSSGLLSTALVGMLIYFRSFSKKARVKRRKYR